MRHNSLAFTPSVSQLGTAFRARLHCGLLPPAIRVITRRYSNRILWDYPRVAPTTIAKIKFILRIHLDKTIFLLTVALSIIRSRTLLDTTCRLPDLGRARRYVWTQHDDSTSALHRHAMASRTALEYSPNILLVRGVYISPSGSL